MEAKEIRINFLYKSFRFGVKEYVIRGGWPFPML
jgi:hypothetical protein